MQFMQIASEGGLLPHPMRRDSFEIWPAVRREFVVDFSHYANGDPTITGDEIYLVNTMKMTTGRKWDDPDPAYKVPILKIVIGDEADDQSVMPKLTDLLRAAPARRLSDADIEAFTTDAAKRGRVFELQRGSVAGQPETEWLINDQPFDPTRPLVSLERGAADVWTIRNGGGGWVHPMHLHQEEHHVLTRNGTQSPDTRHPDDTGKMDVVSLDPGEEVVVYRSFRTFTGPYVAHCHNLAHEDHNMMFGWEILPESPLPDGNPEDGAPPPVSGAGGATVAGGATAGGGGAAGGTTNSGGPSPKTARKKTAATLSCRLMRASGRRVVRCKVSDSRRKERARLVIRIRHAGKDVSVIHRVLHKGRGTIDVPVSRSLKGRYDVVVVLDDGAAARRAITIR
jgi:multicopper oxidase